MKKFEELGLDSELVKPSYIFDTGQLERNIVNNIKCNTEVTYHEENYKHFLNIKQMIKKMVEDLSNDNRQYH